jgi:hypothetical protein
MTLPRIVKASLLLLLVVASVSPAQANALVWLKRPSFACASRRDAELLRSMASQSLKDSAQKDALLNYAKAHCIWLGRGTFSEAGEDGSFACLGRATHACVWVPSELLQTTAADDGVF